MKRVGPHSQARIIRSVDGRSVEGRMLRAIRNKLVSHVGGKPTAVQSILIDRAAILSLRIALMDAHEKPGGPISEKNAREYLCWSNALVRLLRELGLESAPARVPTIAEVFAQRSAA